VSLGTLCFDALNRSSFLLTKQNSDITNCGENCLNRLSLERQGMWVKKLWLP